MDFPYFLFSKKIIIMLKVVILLIIAFATKAYAEYFWRDYYGNLPCDAVEGGTTADGLPTYIGQAVNKQTKNIVTGPILFNKRSVFVTHLPNEGSDHHVKILCSRDTSDLIWIKTNITNMHLLTECNLISAGHYELAPLVVGRANYQGGTYVGHVFNYAPKNWRFFISSSNGIRIEYKEFEVLAHSCKKPVVGTPVPPNEFTKLAKV